MGAGPPSARARGTPLGRARRRRARGARRDRGSFAALHEGGVTVLAGAFSAGSRWTSGDLRTWVEQRTSRQERSDALLQLSIAMAALRSAYEEWQPDVPFAQPLDAARRNRARAGRGFDGG